MASLPLYKLNIKKEKINSMFVSVFKSNTNIYCSKRLYNISEIKENEIMNIAAIFRLILNFIFLIFTSKRHKIKFTIIARLPLNIRITKKVNKKNFEYFEKL